MIMSATVPTSGCRSTRPASMPTRTRNGMNPYEKFPRCSRRFSSHAAKYRRKPSLANSEGWKFRGPRDTQLCELLTESPTPGINTRTKSANVTRNPGSASARHQDGGMRAAAASAIRPSTMCTACCLVKKYVSPKRSYPKTLDAEESITRPKSVSSSVSPRSW